MSDSTIKPRRGFAALPVELRREIARAGGKAAHALGRAHRFTSEEAREAGRKGGRIAAQNRERMAELGRRGGHAKARRGRDALEDQDPGDDGVVA